MADIAFVLAATSEPPDPQHVIEAGSEQSMALEVDLGNNPAGGEICCFTFADRSPGMLMYTFIPAPHPDASSMECGPLSPTAEELAATTSHLILVGFGLEGTDRVRDSIMCRFAAAVAAATDATAAMLGHSPRPQRADSLHELTAGTDG